MPETRTILEATARMAATLGVGLDDLARSAQHQGGPASGARRRNCGIGCLGHLRLGHRHCRQVINLCSGAVMSR